MKKFLLICLAVLMAALTACQGDTPYSIVNEALEQTRGAESFCAELAGEISFRFPSVTMKVSSQASLSVSGFGLPEELCRMDAQKTRLGEKTAAAFYTEGDSAYLSVDGENLRYKKTALPQKYAFAASPAELAFLMSCGLSESVLADASVEKDGKRHIVTLSLTENRFSSDWRDYLELARLRIEEEFELIAMKTDGALLTLTVEKDRLSSCGIQWEAACRVKLDGVLTDVVIGVEDSALFSSLGEELVIQPIEGYEGFGEERLGEAVALIGEALEKTAMLDDLDIGVKISMLAQKGILKFNVPFSIDILGTGMQSEHPRSHIHIKSDSLLLSRYESDIYQNGDVCYTVSDGETTVSSAQEAMALYAGLADAKALMALLPEELLSQVSVVTDDDGNRTVFVSIGDEAFREHYGELLDSAIASAIEDTPIDSVSFSDAKMEITVGESGYLDTCRLTVLLTLDLSGTEVEGNAELVLQYRNPGEAVTVEIPEITY